MNAFFLPRTVFNSLSATGRQPFLKYTFSGALNHNMFSLLSATDAGKIMWVMYEHPEVDFMDMAMRFMDIRKRIYTFPKMGEKAYFIAIFGRSS